MPTLRHNAEDVIGDESAMLDGSAARQRRRLGRGCGVCVNQGPHAELIGFAAGRLELRVGHGLVAAFTDALGGEYLNEVCALLLALIHQLAQLIRIAAVLGQRLQRCQDS